MQIALLFSWPLLEEEPPVGSLSVYDSVLIARAAFSSGDAENTALMDLTCALMTVEPKVLKGDCNR
jgi:hypothetical protein